MPLDASLDASPRIRLSVILPSGNHDEGHRYIGTVPEWLKEPDRGLMARYWATLRRANGCHRG